MPVVRECLGNAGASNRASMSLTLRALVVLFVFAFAFDFKGGVGGTPAQYGMAALNVVSFVLLFICARGALPRGRFPSVVLLGWAAFLIVGSVGAVVNPVPFGHYVRIVYPFVLFFEGFWVAWWVGRRPSGADLLIKAMLSAALVSLLFTFWWGVHFTGDAYGAIRYQILSPLIPFLLVVAGFDLFFASERRLRSLIILVVTLGVIGLSVTRGMLVVMGAVVASLAVAWVRNTLGGSASIPRPFVRSAVWSVIAGCLALLVTLGLYPDVLERWVHRGFGTARDATFWTRLAAVVGQWDQLSAHQGAWIYGLGFGHTYQHALAYANLVAPYIKSSAFDAPMWFPGEFLWVTPLYYAGFVMGTLAVAILLAGAVLALHTVAQGLQARSWRRRAARPVWVGALGYVAFLGLSVTANPFILRSSSLFLGLLLALASTRVEVARWDPDASGGVPFHAYHAKSGVGMAGGA